MSQPRGTCQEVVGRYEELRRRALAGEPEGHRLGLAVLVRQGLAAWLGAWDGLGPTRGAPAPAPALVSAGESELVASLAAMTRACLEAGSR